MRSFILFYHSKYSLKALIVQVVKRPRTNPLEKIKKSERLISRSIPYVSSKNSSLIQSLFFNHRERVVGFREHFKIFKEVGESVGNLIHRTEDDDLTDHGVEDLLRHSFFIRMRFESEMLF